MTLRKILLASTALGAAAVLAGPAFAGSAAATQNEINTLKTQMEMLQQKLNDLQIQTASDIKDLKSAAPASDAYVTVKGHPSIVANDGSFTAEFTGRAHFDMASASTDNGLKKYNNGANFRRGEFGVYGKVLKDWGYGIGFQFGGSGNDGKQGTIKEAFVSYNGFKDLSLQIGALSIPQTLDYATSSNDITFIERAAAANMMISLGADDGRTGVGGTYSDGTVFAMLYYMKSPVGTDATTAAEADSVAGRFAVALHPFENSVLHLGVSGTYAMHVVGSKLSLGDRPGIRVDNIKYIDTGNLVTVDNAKYYGPEVAFATGPFRVQGEYYKYDISRAIGGDVNLDAWYAQASYVLTGESYKYKGGSASFGGIKPANPVGKGGFGAWEIAARYGDSDLNDVAAGVNGGHEKLTTVGLNWYPNNNIRFMLNYIHGDETTNTGGGATVTANGNIDVVALRTQFAF